MELKTKLCTEGVINESLEEKNMSEKPYNPLERVEKKGTYKEKSF